MQFDPVFAESDLILKGIWLTIVLSASAIVLGCTLAILLVALRTLAGRWAGIVVDAYVELMRNTPFLIQLFMIFFGLPLLGIRMSGVEAALLPMTLNLGAYSTEIIRAGVESIHKSQFEAGVSLAMTRRQVFQYVVLQPAFARVWPALSSQFVLMMLATSIMSQISVEELTSAGYIIQSETFRGFEIYLVVAVLYLVLSSLLRLSMAGLASVAFARRRRLKTPL